MGVVGGAAVGRRAGRGGVVRLPAVNYSSLRHVDAGSAAHTPGRAARAPRGTNPDVSLTGSTAHVRELAPLPREQRGGQVPTLNFQVPEVKAETLGYVSSPPTHPRLPLLWDC